MEDLTNGIFCRCCLKPIQKENEESCYSFTQKDPHTDILIYIKIQDFLEIGNEEDVTKLMICLECINLLHHAYQFKNICKKTEIAINTTIIPDERMIEECTTEMFDVKNEDYKESQCDDDNTEIFAAANNEQEEEQIEEEEENKDWFKLIENTEIKIEDTNYTQEPENNQINNETIMNEDEKITVDFNQYFEKVYIDDIKSENSSSTTHLQSPYISCLKITDQELKTNYSNVKLKCSKCDKLFKQLNNLLNHKTQNEKCDEVISLADSENEYEDEEMSNVVNNILLEHSYAISSQYLIASASSANDVFDYSGAQLTDINVFKDALRNLEVTIPFEIHATHKIDTSLKNNSYAKNHNEGSKLPNIQMKKTNFSKEENNILLRNWKHFCEVHDWDEEYPQPFANFRAIGNMLSRENKIKFVQFLGRDLPRRKLYSIYLRFRQIFKVKVSQRRVFKEDEDKLIMSYMNGEFDVEDPWHELKVLLKRPRKRIMQRYNLLRAREGHRPDGDAKTRKIIYELLRVTKKSKVEDLEHLNISTDVFKNVAKAMKETYLSIQYYWLQTVYPRLFVPQEMTLHDVRKAVIKQMRTMDNLTWSCINWTEITKAVPGTTERFLSRMFYYLLRGKKYVKNFQDFDLRDYLDQLEKDEMNFSEKTHLRTNKFYKINYENGQITFKFREDLQKK